MPKTLWPPFDRPSLLPAAVSRESLPHSEEDCEQTRVCRGSGRGGEVFFLRIVRLRHPGSSLRKDTTPGTDRGRHSELDDAAEYLAREKRVWDGFRRWRRAPERRDRRTRFGQHGDIGFLGVFWRPRPLWTVVQSRCLWHPHLLLERTMRLRARV